MNINELNTKLVEIKGKPHLTKTRKQQMLKAYRDYCTNYTELIIFKEESAELLQCISKYKRGRLEIKHLSIKEEIADVAICIDQLAYLFHIEPDMIHDPDNVHGIDLHLPESTLAVLHTIEYILIHMMEFIDTIDFRCNIEREEIKEVIYQPYKVGMNSYEFEFIITARQLLKCIDKLVALAGINPETIEYIKDIKLLRAEDRRMNDEPM